MKKLVLAFLCAASIVTMSSCSNARRVARDVAEFISYDITFDVGKATLKPESDKETIQYRMFFAKFSEKDE